MIASYDGLEEKASQKAATRDMSALNQAVRTFKVLNRKLPNNVESLLSNDVATISTITDDDNVTTTLGSTTTEATLLSTELQALIAPAALTQTQFDNLIAAGITKVRYLDVLGDDETVSNLNIDGIDGNNAASVGAISTIDIPGHAFETPLAGSGNNRGRGFVFDLENATFGSSNQEFAIWGGQNPSSPTDQYDNLKVGAPADSVLVAFGLGNSSTIVKGDFSAKISHAPFYTNVDKEKYNHYIMLVDVTQNPAKLITIVNSLGNSIDEEFSESTEQKN